MTESLPFDVRAATRDDVDQIVALLAAVAEERIWLGLEPPVDLDSQRQRFVERIGEGSTGASLVAVTDDDDRMIGHAGVDLARTRWRRWR